MKSYQKRSKVLTIANALVKEGWKFGEAQKRAWLVVRCIEQMKKDEVILRFYTEGEKEIPQQRTASLAPAYLPYQEPRTEPKKEKKTSPLAIPFFDTIKNGWRSFRIDRFVGFAASELAF